MKEQEDKSKQELYKKIEVLCKNLSFWTLLKIYFYIKKVQLQRRCNWIVWRWLTSKLDSDQQIHANEDTN